MSDQTSAPVLAPAARPTPTAPEFIRLPKTGTLCPYTGLTRSRMNELVLPCPANQFKPPVKSFALRQRGSVKGCRLISYASLMDYLRRQMEAQAA